MKNYCTSLLLSILTVTLMSSCQKDKSETPFQEPKFYYVGYSYSQSYQDADRRALVCIGDSIVRLSPQTRSDAVAIHVYGEDIYTTGFQYSGDTRRVVYWKNAKIKRLGTQYPYNTGTAIFADANNVYVAGTVYETVEGRTVPFQHVWVNDTFLKKWGALSFSGIYDFSPYQGTLYMAGSFGQTATLWTGDTMRSLASNGSEACEVNIVDGDVYVLGWEVVNVETDAVSAWKYREKEERLEKVFSHELGKRIAKMDGVMYGKDYYYVINPNNSTIASVYKNDRLLYDLSGAGNVKAEAIKVYGGKVYVLGHLLEGTSSTPMLWVDGEPNTLFAPEQKIYLHDFFIL